MGTDFFGVGWGSDGCVVLEWGVSTAYSFELPSFQLFSFELKGWMLCGCVVFAHDVEERLVDPVIV